MAVAAPARRSRAVTAPAPSRTTAPKKRKPPARKPARAGAAAPAKAPRTAPARRPVKRAPAPQRPKLAVAAGRTAVAVRQLPDSGLMVRLTRGRAWIGLLAFLLVGIVALNVATLSFGASSGKIDEQITTLEEEISMLESREAKAFSTARIRGEGTAAGLAMPTAEEPTVIEFQPADVATAAARLAAAGG